VVLDPALVVLSVEIGLAGGPELARRVQDEAAAIVQVSPRVVVSAVDRRGRARDWIALCSRHHRRPTLTR
jgi:hypothetical protein